MARKKRSNTPKKRPAPLIHSPNVIQTKARGPIRRTATSLSGPSAGVSGSGSIQSIAQSPLYYDYRWSTPDKFYFPRNRVVANSIWREIYKRDPAVAIGTDMYAELPWSEFELTGIEDKEVLHTYEDMFTKLNIVPKLTNYTRDYLVTGELVLHNMFNSTKGVWERIIPHNPDYIKVEGVGFIMDQPLLSIIPTPEHKRLVNSTDPRVKKLLKLLPSSLINAFRAGKDNPLDALNTTFLPRLNSSTDLRGTSLYTRLFRVIMYEDFIVNASLAVAQRNAAPLRIFKLGDPNTNWIPDQDDEASFAEMLSMAESDPLAAIIMHHNVSCELVGVTDRVLLISREWDYIERVKLLALGVSKAFLVGETSFASAVAGLQTLMERLLSLRNKFEKDWIISKLCDPIAKIQEFYRRPQAEVDHWIRVKKPLDEYELMVPKIRWRKSLEATQDVAILNIWRDMKDRGIVSERTYATGAGVDLNTERKNAIEEKKYKEDHPEIYGIPQPQQQAPGAKPPMKPGAPVPPGPAMPGASDKRSSFRRSANNPYVSRVALERREAALEEALDNVADSEHKVDVRDVLELVSSVEEQYAEDDPAIFPAPKTILTGE